MSFALILVGLCGVLTGALAYAGKWRAWAQRSGYVHCAGFASLYAGLGAIALGVFMLAPRETVPTTVVFVVGVPLLWCGIVGFWWLPGIMLPRWFREGRDQRRRTERAHRELRKQAREMGRERKHR